MLEGVVPYPEEFVRLYRERGYWEDRPLIDHFRDAFARYAERTAIVFGDERVTYGQLGQRVDRLALHLLERWPWQAPFENLHAAIHGPPPTAS